jgi:hypothetical protein
MPDPAKSPKLLRWLALYRVIKRYNATAIVGLDFTGIKSVIFPSMPSPWFSFNRRRVAAPLLFPFLI